MVILLTIMGHCKVVKYDVPVPHTGSHVIPT